MIRTPLKTATSTLIVLVMILLIAWLIGRIASDRYAWSQWLLWIPTPLAIAACLLGVLGSLGHRRLMLVWAIVAVLIGTYFTGFEHRLIRAHGTASSGLRIAFWNGNTSGDGDDTKLNDALLALDADLTILTNAGHLHRYQRLTASLGEDGKRIGFRPFTVFTRLPLLEYRSLVSNDGIEVRYLRVDATAQIGREVSIYAIDLPSDPRIGRMKVAERLRSLLGRADAPPPDIVIGDFNMTRGGAALRTAFPGLVHAYDQVGHGYGATFPRVLRLYHIDHVLLNDSLQALDYRLVNPGLGRHVVQVVDVRPRNMP